MLFSAIVADRGGHWLGGEWKTRTRNVESVESVASVEDLENVVQQVMQDLYARRGVAQKQPYGKSPDIYLSGVKCSLDKARQKRDATLE